jgi:hypothetical protein
LQKGTTFGTGLNPYGGGPVEIGLVTLQALAHYLEMDASDHQNPHLSRTGVEYCNFDHFVVRSKVGWLIQLDNDLTLYTSDYPPMSAKWMSSKVEVPETVRIRRFAYEKWVYFF